MSAAGQTCHVCPLFCAQCAGPMLRREQARVA